MFQKRIHGFRIPGSFAPDNRLALALSFLFIAVGIATAQPVADRSTELGNLLPAPASAASKPGPLLTQNLADVTELEFRARPTKRQTNFDAREEMDELAERIHALNTKNKDGFILALMRERPQLAGLPVRLGDSCRQSADASRQFRVEARQVRLAIGGVRLRVPEWRSDAFWGAYNGQHEKQGSKFPGLRTAALMQILATEPGPVKRELVRRLAYDPDSSATRALAQLAIFSLEEEVRAAAIDALRDRPFDDYTDALLQGLKYPWPRVVEQAVKAVLELDRCDLAPRLVEMLDQPDPRAPGVRQINGQTTTVVREMVRINHNRSCLLCHSPADEKSPAGILTARMPLPETEKGVGVVQYYESETPPLRPSELIRVDVTYLRQDFSVMLPSPTPTKKAPTERYDFLVRERILSECDARDFQKQLEVEASSKLAPHRAVALDALRRMTGQDAQPTSAAWNEILQ